MKSELINKSMLIAQTAHKAINQKRKYSGADYIMHPLEVYNILSLHTTNEIILSVGLLHDVVEDTEITLDFISQNVSPEVAYVLEMVTDISKPEDGNRETRKAIDREHYKTADYRGKMVKLADIISNGYDIKKHDKHFAERYFYEIGLLLPFLEVEDFLYQKAQKMVYDYKIECENERLQNALNTAIL